MATENRLRDTASDYNDIYRNPDARFGIENPRVTRGGREQTLTSRPSEDGRRGRTTPRRYRGPQEQGPDEVADTVSRQNDRVAARYYDSTAVSAPQVILPQIFKRSKVRTSALARARGITFATITTSITLTLWPFQALIGIFGVTVLGMAGLVEESWTAWAAKKFVDFTNWVFGFEHVDLMPMAMIGILIPAIFGLISLGGSALFALLLRLHPLGGNGAALKTGTFMLAIVCYFIPVVNIFPWILLWIWSVARHPK